MIRLKTLNSTVSHWNILLLNSKNESVSYLKCLFTSRVQQHMLSADVAIDGTVMSIVNNVLLQIFADTTQEETLPSKNL